MPLNAALNSKLLQGAALRVGGLGLGPRLQSVCQNQHTSGPGGGGGGGGGGHRGAVPPPLP